MALGEVAVAAAEIDAAPSVEHRIEGEIVVGGEVEVVGHTDFDTAARTESDAREEEPALSLVADRERDPREVEDRHAHELDCGIAAGAITSDHVELDAAGAYPPVRVRSGAGAEPDFLQSDVAVCIELEAFRRPAGRSLGQLEGRVLECGTTGGVVASAAASDLERGVAISDGTVDLKEVRLGIVGDVLCGQDAFALGDAHIAGKHRVAAGPKHCGIAADLNARLGVRRRRRPGRPVRGSRRVWGGACEQCFAH